MDKDQIFIEQHKQMLGSDKAKKMLESLKKVSIDVKDAKKVYINVYGEEVHVNGPVAAALDKPETLAEKIARFERLAANVQAHRQLMASLVQEIVEDEEDPMADKEMEEIESEDEFGDPIILADEPFRDKNVEPKQDNVEAEGGQAAANKKATAAVIAEAEALSDSEE